MHVCDNRILYRNTHKGLFRLPTHGQGDIQLRIIICIPTDELRWYNKVAYMKCRLRQ